MPVSKNDGIRPMVDPYDSLGLDACDETSLNHNSDTAKQAAFHY